MKVTYSLLDKKDTGSVAEAAEEMLHCFPYTSLRKQGVIQEILLPSCTSSFRTPDVLVEGTVSEERIPL